MAQILQPLGKLPQCRIVHPTVLLLPIAGNEGDRIARIEQVDDVLYVSFRLAQLRRQGLCDLQVLSLLCLSVCAAWASAQNHFIIFQCKTHGFFREKKKFVDVFPVLCYTEK